MPLISLPVIFKTIDTLRKKDFLQAWLLGGIDSRLYVYMSILHHKKHQLSVIINVAYAEVYIRRGNCIKISKPSLTNSSNC